jgi:5-methylcytosine-specific restriction enzyme subunit McrC
MTRGRVQLTERSAREIRLPKGDVEFLLTHARNLLEVTPTFRAGFYRVVPLAFVGWFDSPTLRFAIRPKVPWPTLRMLLGLSNEADSGEPNPHLESGLLNVLARELSDRLREVVRLGLVAGYREQDTSEAYLRGKLRAAAQVRDAATRAFPDRFHVTDSILDLDTPWNRIPRAIAADLIENPDLPDSTRIELREAIQPFDSVPLSPLTDADFIQSETDSRVAHYRPLLALCRWLHEGFAVARLPGLGSEAFLIDLSRMFERYLTDELRDAFSGQPDWSVESQPKYAVGPVILQPDIAIRKHAKTRAVLDAKWKVPGPTPDAADLHQIIAYAAVSGTHDVGLVYPGRQFARKIFSVPGTPIRVSLFRVRLVGTANECSSSIFRLSRVLRSRKS